MRERERERIIEREMMPSTQPSKRERCEFERERERDNDRESSKTQQSWFIQTVISVGEWIAVGGIERTSNTLRPLLRFCFALWG